MSKIHILSRQVTELIAAGEVVDRPASVVKEVMENAIDAGASSITVEIKNGGITYIRITDNGSGINKDDIENAFKSHATSKITSATDLDAICTLGFRGEALASIAAMSKVEIITRSADDDIGSRYCIDGGEKVLFDQAGCPKGTTLIIRDLFYNTPARMKFMKKDVSEANAAAGVVDRIALSHPEVAIRFIRDGKQTLLTPGDGKLINAANSILGREFSNGLVEADYVHENIKVSGFVSKPAAARPNRSLQFFFLNGRLIKTVTGSTALGEAYKNSIMTGKFPSCILNIEISPELVDVNVHPAKIEARFANEKELFNAVYYCAKNAIDNLCSKPDIRRTTSVEAPYIKNIHQIQQMTLPVKREEFWGSTALGSKTDRKANIDITVEDINENNRDSIIKREQKEIENVSTGEQVDGYKEGLHANTPTNTALGEPEEVFRKKTSISVNDILNENQIQDENDTKPFIRVIGEVFNTYILAETSEILLIIDKHAAHERMIFNKLSAANLKESSQIMLTPVTVLLSKDEYSAVLENLAVLSAAGFSIEDFGPGMVLVRECPMILAVSDINDVVIELAGYLVLNKSEMITEKQQWILQSVACRAAIKAGDFTSDYERKRFVDELLLMPEVRFCPHGRPVYIEMKRNELEKDFGRT